MHSPRQRLQQARTCSKQRAHSQGFPGAERLAEQRFRRCHAFFKSFANRPLYNAFYLCVEEDPAVRPIVVCFQTHPRKKQRRVLFDSSKLCCSSWQLLLAAIALRQIAQFSSAGEGMAANWGGQLRHWDVDDFAHLKKLPLPVCPLPPPPPPLVDPSRGVACMPSWTSSSLTPPPRPGPVIIP